MMGFTWDLLRKHKCLHAIVYFLCRVLFASISDVFDAASRDHMHPRGQESGSRNRLRWAHVRDGPLQVQPS